VLIIHCLVKDLTKRIFPEHLTAFHANGIVTPAEYSAAKEAIRLMDAVQMGMTLVEIKHY
jgi:hypothetical protein